MRQTGGEIRLGHHLGGLIFGSELRNLFGAFFALNPVQYRVSDGNVPMTRRYRQLRQDGAGKVDFLATYDTFFFVLVGSKRGDRG